MEQVFSAENVKVNHLPTFAGTESVSYILGGHVDSVCAPIMGMHVRTGKVRALASRAKNE